MCHSQNIDIVPKSSTQALSNFGAAAGVVDKLSISNDIKGHTQLVHPRIFNISAVFQPTYEFIQQVQQFFQIRLDKKSEIYDYLNDLILKCYYPQVEDIVVQHFHEYVNGISLLIIRT